MPATPATPATPAGLPRAVPGGNPIAASVVRVARVSVKVVMAVMAVMAVTAVTAAVALLALLPTGPLWAAGLDADETARQAAFVQQVLVRVNGYRASLGLGLLQPDAGLTVIATEHSQRMARRQHIGHDGFDQRFERSRRHRCVETLAADFTRADDLLAAWLASPAHQAQLRVPQVRDVGVASVQGYVTLLACE